MTEPRTFQPEQHNEMMDHLSALSPHGVTVTNADGSVTVTAAPPIESDARTVRGSKTTAYRYGYHAAQDGRTKAATLGPFADEQSQWLARNGWEDGVADMARCPDCGSGTACNC